MMDRIVLSSRFLGRIGAVGSINPHVETGELMIIEQTMTEIEDRTQRFAVGTAL